MATTEAAVAAADPAHPAGRYSAPARFFHWAIAFLILIVWPIGPNISRFDQIEWLHNLLYFIHENLGVTIWLLVLARLAWRRLHPPPPLPAGMPGWMQRAAHATHAALYVLLLVQPVLGFLATNAFGFPLAYFGLVPLPSPVGHNEPLGNLLLPIHLGVGLALLGVIIMHVGAALFHHVVRRDGVLKRMT